MKPDSITGAVLCIVFCPAFRQSVPERLAAVGNLWIAAKSFDPFLANQDIGRDQALITRDVVKYHAAVHLTLDSLRAYPNGTAATPEHTAVASEFDSAGLVSSGCRIKPG